MIEIIKKRLLLEPSEHNFEKHGVFNPGVIEKDGQIHLLYRATSKANYSTIGYCRLKTPTEIEIRAKEPVFIPEEMHESRGVEDPRVVNIEGTFYMTYTAYDGVNAMGALATSRDLKTFNREGVITPQFTYREFQLCVECCDGLNEKYMRHLKTFYEHSGDIAISRLLIWDKDVIFFPRKINGRFAFMHRIYPDIQICYFTEIRDLNYQYWKNYLFNLKQHIMLSGKMQFESSYIGGGCPPIETDEGWLIIYHGVEDTTQGYVYHAGAALMDLDDPTVEIGRLKVPLFSPEQDWEKSGVVNNVVFPTGTLVKDDVLYIYYGAADKRIGVVSVVLSYLLKEIKMQRNQKTFFLNKAGVS